MPEEVIDPKRRPDAKVLWDHWEIYSMSKRHEQKETGEENLSEEKKR